jgi:hypothetical protein
MNKKRILKLADYMEKLDAAKYDQGSWFEGRVNIDALHVTTLRSNSNFKKVSIPEGACGTTACVLGHAIAAIPEAKLFWSMSKWEADEVAALKEDGWTDTSLDLDVALVKDGGVKFGFEAAQAALDIPFRHAMVMFGGDVGPQGMSRRFYGELTPAAVAKALRNYVATNGQSADDAYNAYHNP